LPAAEGFVAANPEEVVVPAFPDRVVEEAAKPAGGIVEDGDGALARGDRREEDVDGTPEDDDPAGEPAVDGLDPSRDAEDLLDGFDPSRPDADDPAGEPEAGADEDVGGVADEDVDAAEDEPAADGAAEDEPGWSGLAGY
jgi:hypothetical protein